MKKLSNRKGMTLIEIIVALAILGIIFIAFLNMFGSGIQWIIFAGHKSRAEFLAQDAVENYINGVAPADPNAAISTSHGTLTVNFGAGRSISVSGDTAALTYSFRGKSSTVTSFLPD